MSYRSVAIAGSGIAATLVAKVLSERGFLVTLFEKGPDYAYPHAMQLQERHLYFPENPPSHEADDDLKNLTLSGTYSQNPDRERFMRVGGSATVWTAITPRMHPSDFRTRSRFGFGVDWPLTYDDLEPYYSQAEKVIGVSGTDDDNPFAPRRSSPFPLPPFELTPADLLLATRLNDAGIRLHSTPQARTRQNYEERPACQNFVSCRFCPIGARYSPNHELRRLLENGRVTLRTNTSVRRILTDRSGKARGLLVQENDGPSAEEFPADVVVVAAGALESARLLLLSRDQQYPAGIGNASGSVGQQFTFHHLWIGTLRYRQRLFTGMLGPITGQTQQFCSPAARGRHGGIKVEFSSHFAGFPPSFNQLANVSSGREILELSRDDAHCRGIIFHAESSPERTKYLRLAALEDRFGDPFIHLHYESSEFDQRTYGFAKELLHRFESATAGEVINFDAFEAYDSGSHHMGGCVMGTDPRTSVVSSMGGVHGCQSLFVVGSSVFPGTSGCMNPTLTLSALALRTAESIARGA